MSEDLTALVQRLTATTAASAGDILNAISALRSNDAQLPEPWTDGTIARALPSLVEMAARSSTSVRSVAAAARATTAQPRPDEEPST